MQLGLVGLGKMGFNMRERLREGGHEVVGYDRNPDVSDSSSLADMVKQLDAPRNVWIMVPSGAPTRDTVHELADLLDAGDLVIDGDIDTATEFFAVFTIPDAHAATETPLKHRRPPARQ